MNPFQPADIGIILSYKCQSRCAHCLYNCGPEWQDWMSLEDVHLALESMLIWNHRFQVHFTGGEPFLKYPLLLESVKIANKLGIPFYVEANAGWCVQDEITKSRFSELKSAGLRTVLISCSPFHAESIPPVHTFRGIEKAVEVFGSRNVIVYLPEWLQQISQFNAEKKTPLEQYTTMYGKEYAGKLFWEGYSLISGGRSGFRLGSLTSRYPASRFQGEKCCREILYAHHSHFDLYGNYISGFCGGLSIGRWYDLEKNINKLSSSNYPPLIDILISGGPYGLLEFASHSYGFKPDEDGYVGKCHLCVDARRHLAVQNDFVELQPAQFYEMI